MATDRLALPTAIDQSIGPGLGGFLVTFFMAVALVILLRSMVKHLRKVRYSPDPAERATRQIVIPSSTQVDLRRSDAAAPDGEASPGGRSDGSPSGSSDSGAGGGGSSD